MSIDFNPQIPFIQQHQQRSELCWIAVAVSVKRHFDPTSQMRQCELAKALLGITGPCCTDPDGVLAPCNKPGRLEVALGSVQHLAPTSRAAPNPNNNGQPMAFADVQQQIDRNLPVCIFIQWPGEDIGHFILISGYLESAGKQYLWVNDPLYGSGPKPYQQVVSNYHSEHGTWQCSYLLKG